MGLGVVVAGAFCVPKQPEVWLIGRTEKPKGGHRSQHAPYTEALWDMY